MARRVAALGISLALLSSAPELRADFGRKPSVICADFAAHPAMISFGAGALDTSRSACTASTDVATVRSIFGVGDADFADAIETSLMAMRRWETKTGFEIELGARLVRYTHLDGVDISSDSFELGPIVLGAADGDKVRWFGLDGRWLAQLRLEVPRSDTGIDVTAVSASPALSWSAIASGSLRLHSRLALLLFATPATDIVEARASAALSFDATTRLTKKLSAAAGVEGQAAVDDPDLDHLVVRGALRLGTETQASLSVGAPVVGNNSAALVVVVGVTRRR